MKVIGYCSTSSYSQDIRNQKKAILRAYPDAEIQMDQRTHEQDGLYENKWDRLVAFNKLLVDVLVMDSVTRMKCEPKDAFRNYERLYNNGVELVFLKEPELNSSVFHEAEKEIDEIETDEDSRILFKNVLKNIRKLQIEAIWSRVSEEQTQRSDVAKQAVQKAMAEGKQVGRKTGAKVKSTKEGPAKELILQHDKNFVNRPGFIEKWTAEKIMKEAAISRPTYRKYLKELLQAQIREAVAAKYKQRHKEQ